MYGFWYDYVQPEYREKAKLCYMDTDSFILYIKTEDIYPDIVKYIKTRFDTSNYEVDRPFPRRKIVKRENNDRVCRNETQNIELFKK